MQHIQLALHWAKQQTKNTPQTLIIVLSIISGVGTFSGLLDLMSSHDGYSFSGVIMALALVTVLQSLLIYALHLYQTRRQPGALLVVAFLIFNSFTMAQVFWSNAFGIFDTVSNTQYQRQLDRTLEGLHSQHFTHKQLVNSTDLIVQSALQLQQAEARGEGTCGYHAIGNGPRSKYRAQDAEMLTQFMRGFENEQVQLDQLVAKAETLKLTSASPETLIKLNRVIAQTNAIAQQSDIKPFRGWLQERARQSEQGTRFMGRSILCPLPAAFKTLSVVEALVMPTVANVEILDARDKTASILMAYKTSLNMLVDPQQLEAIQWVGLLFALFIDGALLWVGFSQSTQRLPMNDQKDSLAWIKKVGETVLPEQMTEVMTNSVRANQGVRKVFVPTENHNSTLALMISTLEHYGACRYAGVRSRYFVPQHIREQQGEQHKQYSHYDIPMSLYNEWLCRANTTHA